MSVVSAERALLAAVQQQRGTVAEVVTALAANPELGYAEHFAHDLLTRVVTERGIAVESGLAGMATAFRARTGSGPLRVAVLAEYDALPDIGHGCGHNVIAGTAVGVFLALAQHGVPATVELIGCPAEESTVEGAGGKIRLLADGAFDGVDLAVTTHPYDVDVLATEGNLAAQGLDVVFTGRAAHAAMRAEDGLNALDAVVLTYSAVALARQHLPTGQRVHGIITDGGASPNVVPERAALRYRMRAGTLEELRALADRLRASARGAAQATGCSVTFSEFMPAYADLRLDPGLVRIARQVADDLGIDLAPAAGRVFGSTDLGNVSHVVRTLEFGVGLGGPGVDPHTRGFAAAANSPAAVDAAIRGARAVSLCVLRAVSAQQATREEPDHDVR